MVMMGNHTAEIRARAAALRPSWGTGSDQCSQVNGEEDSAMMFFAVLPSEISSFC